MELRIRVGAAIDRSMTDAFRPLVQAAERARQQIERTARSSGQAQVRETARSVSGQEKAFAKLTRETERWQREQVRAAERAAAAKISAAERAARGESRAAERAARERARAEARQIAAARQEARQRARDQISAEREVEREIARSNRARERAGAKAARDEARAARNHWTTKFFDPHRNVSAAVGFAGSAARRAVGIAGDIARGAGVRLDPGSYMASEVALEKGAVDLSNASYMPGEAGKGPNGRRVDPKELIAQMRQVGQATAFDPNAALEGLQKFVAKTGDLQSGRDVILDMARYARASGAELDDMVDAAGDVSNALGDVPNKGEAIKNVMRAIAAQGKEGAVEIKDLATQMAKLGAASSQFTGERGMVMAQMGALAQMTRAKGGAASATQAATAVGSFTNTFSKGARLDAFKHFGVDMRGADQKIDVKKVILGSIAAAAAEKNGGMANFDRNMGKMFMDVSARRVTKGFETVYKEAGGGDAGLRAVEKALDDLTNATMNEKEVSESFAASMKTTEAQVQQFNNEMSNTANELKSVLLPAFQGLAPVLLDLTKKGVDWLARITGQKDADDQNKQVNAELAALNAKGGMSRALQATSIEDSDIQKIQSDAAEAKKRLEFEIAKKAQVVADERKNFDLGFGHAMSDDEIAREAKSPGSGGDDARKFLQDKEALARMKDTLEQMNRQQNDLADRIASRTLRVQLVGDTRPPEITFPPGSRQPTPEERQR